MFDYLENKMVRSSNSSALNFNAVGNKENILNGQAAGKNLNNSGNGDASGGFFESKNASPTNASPTNVQQMDLIDELNTFLIQSVDLSKFSELEKIKNLILELYKEKIFRSEELNPKIELKVSNITNQILNSDDYDDDIKIQQIKDLLVGVQELENSDVLLRKILSQFDDQALKDFFESLSQLNDQELKELFVEVGRLENSDIHLYLILSKFDEHALKDLFEYVEQFEKSLDLQFHILRQFDNKKIRSFYDQFNSESGFGNITKEVDDKTGRYQRRIFEALQSQIEKASDNNKKSSIEKKYNLLVDYVAGRSNRSQYNGMS